MKKLTTTLLILTVTFTWAQPVPDSSLNKYELQIGLAAVSSQSIYLGGSSQTRFFPAIDYHYKRFYFQAGDLGFNLMDNNNWKVDMGFGVNLVGDIDRGDSRELSHLPDLSYPLSAFVSAQYKSPIGLFKLKHNHEINNKHDGNSSSLSYAAAIRKAGWLIMPKLTYTLHSDEVLNYFYGVDTEYATNEIPAYWSDSGDSYQLSILGLKQINSKWSILANLQNEFYGNEISNSPIVKDDQRLSIFVGFLYKVF
ncbi:MAG: MipA/OmpV family protein [Marinicella sp.]